MDAEIALGQVLRDLRRQRGLSQEALALEAGLQRNYVSLLERGQNSASIKTLFKLSRVLAVPPSALLARVEAKMAAKLPSTSRD
ncbi:MAG TPA: helix-turn-helix transcriptional regulator [Rhodanobacteraceae bacterium]|nr:helix-turn-helix transcriptional regulator [Rhodanobacteraceae bacterium]